MRALLHVLGLGALIAGGFAFVLGAIVLGILLGPFVFWLAWNVLDFGPAVGLPELGFWAIVLATLFLVIGWFGKVVIAGMSSSSNPPGSAAPRRWAGPSPRSATSSRSRSSPCSRRSRTRTRAAAAD